MGLYGLEQGYLYFFYFTFLPYIRRNVGAVSNVCWRMGMEIVLVYFKIFSYLSGGTEEDLEESLQSENRTPYLQSTMGRLWELNSRKNNALLSVQRKS
jgi:hypothetical protein